MSAQESPVAADDWRDHAACRGQDPELFITQGLEDGGIDKQQQQQQQALAFCAICPSWVRSECLVFALEHGEPGVWGGTTGKQRIAIRRRSGAWRHNSWPSRDDDTTTRAAWLHRHGWRPAEICAELGIGLRELYRRLADAGVEVTPPPGLAKEDQEGE